MTLHYITLHYMSPNCNTALVHHSTLHYICAYVRTYIHTHKQTNKQTYIHTYRQTDRQTDRHPCITTYRQTYIHASTHAYMQACMHACIHTYIHAFTHECLPWHDTTSHYITVQHLYIAVRYATWGSLHPSIHPSTHPSIHPFHTRECPTTRAMAEVSKLGYDCRTSLLGIVGELEWSELRWHGNEMKGNEATWSGIKRNKSEPWIYMNMKWSDMEIKRNEWKSITWNDMRRNMEITWTEMK